MTTTIKPLSTAGQPAPTPATVSNLVSEWDAQIHSRLTALETKAASEVKSVGTWLKGQWPHLVSYAGLGYMIVKHL